MRPINKLIGRVLIPLITPFRKDYEIDYRKVVEITDLVISKKYCDSIIVCGTTGEFHALTFEERIKLFKAVKDAVKGRVPLIAGTGAAYTRHTIDLTKEAEKIGVDMAMVIVPFYSKPTQEGIYRHFKAVAESTSLPVMIYNIPLFAGVNIEPDTVRRLSKLKNIVGIKEEASVNPTQASEFYLAVPRDFCIYCGDDAMILQVLSQGGVGVVSAGAHVVGDIMKQMINEYLKGNVKKATELHIKMYPFSNALCQNNRINPIPLLKEAINICGLNTGNPRLPLTGANEEERKVLIKVLRELKKI